MKEIVGTALLISLLLGGVVLGLRGCAQLVESEGRAQAVAIAAEGQRAIDEAISRQMDAATAAVVADTRAAHSPLSYIVPFVTIGAVLALVVIGLAGALVWQQAQLKALAAQLRQEGAQ